MEKINCIPDTIKHYRALRNMTLEDLSAELGVAISTVGRWERGECVPSAVDANALAKALRISPQTLVEGRKAS
jgi:transcriptional regulator with XRE-family HTH domain